MNGPNNTKKWPNFWCQNIFEQWLPDCYIFFQNIIHNNSFSFVTFEWAQQYKKVTKCLAPKYFWTLTARLLHISPTYNSHYFIFFATFEWAQQGVVLHCSRPERLARDQHSSFLGTIVSYRELKILWIWLHISTFFPRILLWYFIHNTSFSS